MIHLRVIGALSLRGSDGQEIEPVLRRPKYLALLTYLAVASPQGFHRKDTLVALLWPELDQVHARSALRSAVHYLRRKLGAGVIAARGEEELSVDATTLWSDVAEFETALDAGRAHLALDLYRGDFLSGFHVSEAPDFEHWLDQVRDRLRRHAADAASRLAEFEQRQGNLIASLEWMRRAVEVSNYEEEKVRHFIELLADAGDRAGALRIYRDLRRRLAADLDVEPSPATKALVDEIRSLQPPTSVFTPGDQSRELWMSDETPTEDGPSVRPLGLRPLERRHFELLLVLLAVMAVSLVGGRIAWQASSQTGSRLTSHVFVSTEADSVARVVVFPFNVQGGSELGYLREGLAEVVSEAIDGVGNLRRVHPLTVMTRLHQESSGETVDQQQANRTASLLGARYYILGSVVGRGTRLAISASLYAVDDRPQPRADAFIEEKPDRLGALANQLTRGLVADLPVGEGARLRNPGTIRTTSFYAFKAYLQGESLLRRAQYDSAVTRLKNAVDADSTFAVAWYRLGLAYSLAQSMGHEGDNHASLEKAMQYRDNLSPHDHLLLSGWHAHFHGQPEVAERVARQIIGGYPDDAEAWHLLGLTRMWYAWQRGRPYVDARAALGRALAIDPRYPDAIYHAYWAAVFDAQYAYADSVFRAAPRGLVTGPWSQAARGLFVFAHGDSRAQASYTRSLETIDDQSLIGVAWVLASHSDSLRTAERLLSRIAGPSTEHSDWGRASGQIFLGHLEAAQGRWNEAQALFRRAAPFDAATALSSYAWLAAMPFFERPAAELLAIRDSVRKWQVPVTQRDDGHLHPQTIPEVLTIPDELRPWARDYLLGLLSVRLGDREDARQCAARLDAATEPRDQIGLRHDLAIEIRASAALADGKPDAALRLLEGASMAVAHSNQVWYSPYYSRPLGRFLRAEALRLLGRDEEALGWYGTLGEKYGTEFVYLAPALRRQADIYERRGEDQKALEYYRRFSVRWQDADREYQSAVHQVRARMTVMQAKAVNPRLALDRPAR